MRALELIEAHQSECACNSIKINDDTHGSSSDAQESKSKQSFSATVMQLSKLELTHRLSAEGRTLFACTLAGSSNRAVSRGYFRELHLRGLDTETTPKAIAGWQRYRVTFGGGRMGLEIEYDARVTRRLVITSVSKEAAVLGVRAQDVLIGIDDRIVPRATEPFAIHQHLVACMRPVTLHFYRLHLWDHCIRPAEAFYSSASQVSSGKTVTAVASALWDRLLTGGGVEELDVSGTNVMVDDIAPGADMRRTFSESLIPTVRMDTSHYGKDDDGESRDAGMRCLLNEKARTALARALKPLLQHKPWELVYDSACDGMCLEALYARAGQTGPRSKRAQIIICRDDVGHVAGAFLDEPVRNVGDYFGTGECFVFTVAGRSGPGLLTTDIPRGPDVTVYRWVGPDDQASHLSRTHCDEEVVCTSTPLTPPPQVVNDMFAYATPEVLGFGSGGDGFALRLDETLE
mmetsp:Transcript_8912/g.28317  ORF Transcript_8912/g.28317 Transcript_8912/m.28317 type:complete len:460 (-) Transcript_8912:484-1863(-)